MGLLLDNTPTGSLLHIYNPLCFILNAFTRAAGPCTSANLLGQPSWATMSGQSFMSLVLRLRHQECLWNSQAGMRLLRGTIWHQHQKGESEAYRLAEST